MSNAKVKPSQTKDARLREMAINFTTQLYGHCSGAPITKVAQEIYEFLNGNGEPIILSRQVGPSITVEVTNEMIMAGWEELQVYDQSELSTKVVDRIFRKMVFVSPQWRRILSF